MKQLGLFPALLVLLFPPVVPPPLAVCVGVVVLLPLLLVAPPEKEPVPLMPLHTLALLFTIEFDIAIVDEEAAAVDLIRLLLAADDMSIVGGFMAYDAR